MLDFLNSRAYTVADLKSIAERMNLSYPSKATKPVLAGLIADAIDAVQGEAETENRHRVVRKIADGYAKSISEMSDAQYRMISRYQAYQRQNRSARKITPAQRRRINKNANRHGLAEYFISAN